VSVGAIIGSRNLGYLFLNGRQRNNLEEILIGIVASILIALLFDLILVALGRLVMPWNETTRVRALLARFRGLAAKAVS
jgi:osmoprotectant transport system permease protein